MANKERLNVLIIDDNEVARMLLRGILRSDDAYEVVAEATGAKRGIELALELAPDIICLDNVMPGTTGLEVLLQIRPKLPNTLIVMVTGSTDRETVEAALQGGADGYIVKPYNSARVLAALEQGMAKARSQKDAT